MVILRQETKDYRRVSVALFLAGFATFSLLYCVQPLLPIFAQTFNIDPAQSSLSLSLATGFLAFAVFCAAPLSEYFGRRGLMFVSIVSAALLNMAAAFTSNWTYLLIIRSLEGFMLGGVPAIAMAFLAEEILPNHLGFITGLYVAGTAFGGMIGRVGSSFLVNFFSWQLTLIVIGMTGLLSALGFIALLPPSRHFVRHKNIDLDNHWYAWKTNLENKSMFGLYVIGFAIMGSFVAIYNYTGFRLVAAPYSLSQKELGLIFTVYIFGMVASSVAGLLVNHMGRSLVLRSFILVTISGIALTQLSNLTGIIFGIILLTIGFFGAHSVASGWVGRMAIHSKSHASSLYFLSYYLGSSIVGLVAGWVYTISGWGAVGGFTVLLLLLAFLITFHVKEHVPQIVSES